MGMRTGMGMGMQTGKWAMDDELVHVDGAWLGWWTWVALGGIGLGGIESHWVALGHWHWGIGIGVFYLPNKDVYSYRNRR